MTPDQLALDIITLLADFDGDLTTRVECLCRKWNVAPVGMCGYTDVLPTLQKLAQRVEEMAVEG